MTDALEYIKANVSREDLLYQLAEEASELSHAALKLARKLKGSNPTPKSLAECESDLIEESADVALCLQVLELCTLDGNSAEQYVRDLKAKRWEERLRWQIG